MQHQPNVFALFNTNIIEQQQQYFNQPRLVYFVSDVMAGLNIEDTNDMDASLCRALQVCSNLQIPFNQHFKKVFRSDGENTMVDWKISSFACYLIVINCNPSNGLVAKAQLHFAMKKMGFDM